MPWFAPPSDTNVGVFAEAVIAVCDSGATDEHVVEALKALCAEAARGKSSTLTLGFHLRITGRPARFRACAEILDHLATLEPHVWRATRAQIATHFNATVPRGT